MQCLQIAFNKPANAGKTAFIACTLMMPQVNQNAVIAHCRVAYETRIYSIRMVIFVGFSTGTEATTHGARQASTRPPIVRDILPAAKSVQNGPHLLEIRVASAGKIERVRGERGMAAHGRMKTRRATKRK